MSMIIDPNTGLTFPDGSQQDTAGVPANLPAFSAYQEYASGSQAVPATTFTKLVLHKTEYVFGGGFDLGLGRYTAPVPGIYTFTGEVAISTQSDFIVVLYKNGTSHKTGIRNSAALSGGVTADIRMELGDYVELFVYVGTAQSLGRNPPVTNYFQGRYVRGLE